MKPARSRSFYMLQAEAANDERHAIEAAGGVAPHPDGSAKTVIRSANGGLGAFRCSCGAQGEIKSYLAARAEARAHRCEVKP